MSHLSTLINRANARIEVNQKNQDALKEDTLFRQTIENLEEYQQLWTDWSQEEKRVANDLIEKYRFVIRKEERLEPRPLKIINAEIVMRIQLAEGNTIKMHKDGCLRGCFEELKETLYNGDFLDHEQKHMAEKLYQKYVGIYFPEEGERLNPRPIELKYAIKTMETATDDDIKALVREVVELLCKHVQFEYVNCKLSKIQCSGNSLKTIIGVHKHMGYSYGLDLLIRLGRYIRQYPNPHLDWNQFTSDHINQLKDIRERLKNRSNLNEYRSN
jgi:hypothetical protein